VNPDTAAQGLVGILASAALVAFWWGPLRWFAVDWARDRMFEARERLFDAASDGRIAFDDPDYREIRGSINSLIRYAHGVSLSRLLFHSRLLRSPLEDACFDNSPRKAAERIADPTAQRIAFQSIAETEKAAITLVAMKSPIITSIVILGLLWQSSKTLDNKSTRRQRLRKILIPYTNMILAEASMS
jgi:hypothetical protein